MTPQGTPDPHNPLQGVIPTDQFLLTAGHDGQRSGVLASWLQQCALDPLMIMVATPKCLPVEPLIRDSQHFGICHLHKDDLFTRRKFAEPPDRRDDPFMALPVELSERGSPILQRAEAFLDCKLTRHIDLENGYLIYVGTVLEMRTLNGFDPNELDRLRDKVG